MEGSLEFHRVGVLIGKRMGNRNPVEGLMLKMFLIGSPAIRSFFRLFVERREFKSASQEQQQRLFHL